MPLLALLILLSLELEYIETTTEKVLSIKRQIILIAILSFLSPPSPHHMLEKCGISSFDSTFYTSPTPKFKFTISSVRCDFFSFSISRMPPLYYMWANCRLLLFLVAFLLSLVSFLTHIIVNSYLYGVYLCDYFFSFPPVLFLFSHTRYDTTQSITHMYGDEGGGGHGWMECFTEENDNGENFMRAKFKPTRKKLGRETNSKCVLRKLNNIHFHSEGKKTR